MSDQPPDSPRSDATPGPQNTAPRKVAARSGVTRGTTRRPRHSPAYTAARSAYLARQQDALDAPRRRLLFIVPIVLAIVVLALILTVIIDRTLPSRNSAAAPTAIPTSAVQPTALPTNTPIPITPPPTTKSGVAAEVNGQIVPMDLYTAVIRVDANGLQAGSTDPSTGQSIAPVDITTAAGLTQLHQHEQADLTQLIQTAAAVAYAKQHNLVATAKQVQTSLAALYTQAGGQAAFLKGAEAQGYSASAVTKLVTDGTTEQNVFVQIGKKAPYDGKIVRYIVFAAKDKTLATTVAKQLQADHGSNFAALAKKYSTDTQTAAQGGTIGVVIKGQMEPTVEKVVFALKKDQISDPVQSQQGWEILEVLGPGQSSTSQNTYFSNWLKKQVTSAKIYVKIPNP